MSNISLRKLVFHGETSIEKLLSLSLIVALLSTILSVLYIVVADVPPKFYSVVFFNLVAVAWLFHLRNQFIEESEGYKKLRSDLTAEGFAKEKIDDYVNSKKEWDVFKAWIQFIVLFALLTGFVYLLIP